MRTVVGALMISICCTVVGGAIAKSNGAFFFIWTLLALGVTALFSVILSARGLWEQLTRRTAGLHKQGARA